MTLATLPPLSVAKDGVPATLPFTDDCTSQQQMAAQLAVVPGYEVLGELGRGGMGVVYKARQLGLNRVVALKMVLAGGYASAGDLDRFHREAEAVAKLPHPNIVQIHEVGQIGGLPYFCLEFCAGDSLAAKLKGTPLPPAQAAELVETLARAMHAAHQAGIIHRDLKPANILLAQAVSEISGSSANRYGNSRPVLAGLVPKVTDFGLAKTLDAADGPTQSGAIMGTPSYMAPEQAAGDAKRVGPAADIYALGAILYECLTGRPPFKAATSLDTILQVIEQEPVPPSRLNRAVPRDLVTICLKCLEKDQAKRYLTAADLADDLGAFRDGRPIRAKPVRLLDRAIKAALRHPRAATAVCAATVLISMLLFPIITLDQRVLQSYAMAIDSIVTGVGAFPLMVLAYPTAHIVLFMARQKRPWREAIWGVIILLTAAVPLICLLGIAVVIAIRTFAGLW